MAFLVLSLDSYLDRSQQYSSAPMGQPGTRGPFEHPTALLCSHVVHCAFLSTHTVPVPHHAQGI